MKNTREDLKMKAKQPLTAEEKFKQELLLESEVARARRQHRILERDRGAFSSGPVFVRQEKLINILGKEKHNILTDLDVATSSTKKNIDRHINTNLSSLLGEYDSFNDLIKEKKENLDELDYQIDKVKKDIVIIKTKVPTEVSYAERVLQGRKSVEALENKLEVANTRCCTILTENRLLREEIDHLLQQRINFNTVWDKLIENLHKGKAFMLDLIEQSSLAYNQRDEWCTKLQVLRTYAHADLITHTQQMQDLQRKIDNDSKLEDFFIIKGQKRVMRGMEEKEEQKRQAQRKRLQQNLNQHKETLAEILESTGDDSVDKLLESFAKRDSENFALCNNIIVLNSQIEDLSEYLVVRHNLIDHAREIRNGREERQSDNLAKLRAECEKATREADKSETNLDKTNNLLNQIYNGIDKLFKLCKCSNAPFLQLLGNNTSIHHHNSLLYLDVLEDRVSELLTNTYYIEKTTPKKQEIPHLIDSHQMPIPFAKIDQIVPTSPCPLCVEAEMVCDVIEYLQFVESKDAVQDKLGQRLQLPDGLERLHNVSACNLPRSRQIMQKRYQ